MIITVRTAKATDQTLITQFVHGAHLNPMRLTWPNFLIAEQVDAEPHVVGIGQLRPHKDGILELASLVVADEVRGKGVGSQLVNALIDKANRPLYLMCESDKVPYYERFGFYELKEAHTIPQSLRFFYRLAKIIGAIAALLRQEPPRLAIMAHRGQDV